MPHDLINSLDGAKASFTVWLATQCQLIHGVQHAQLHLSSDWRCVAVWPATTQAQVVLPFLNKVEERGQLQLTPIDKGLRIGYPIKRSGELWGILIIDVKDSDQKRLPEFIQQLKLGQFWLECLLRKSMMPKSTQPAVVSTSHTDAALTLLHTALKESTLAEVGIGLTNQLATAMGAVRVSIAWQQGKTLVLQAVSFSAHFDRRTEAIQLVEKVLFESFQQGVPLQVRAVADTVNPAREALLASHHQLLQQQHLKAVYSYPLRAEQKVMGALCIELHKHETLEPAQEALLQQTLGEIARILDYRLQANEGLWQSLKRRTKTRLERMLGQSWTTRLAMSALLLAIAVLWLPIDYRPSIAATLAAKEVYWVVAPHDGFLGDVVVRPGDAVDEGGLLARLQDDDLKLERRKVASAAQQAQQAYDAALANGQRVEAAIANAQWEQARIQLQLLDQQLKRTHLLSPMTGIIVSDDKTQQQGAPIKQGDLLFEIASATGYRVDIFVDENDLSFIHEGQSGYFQLSSWPDEPIAFSIAAITPQSEVRDSRNVFRVEAQIESSELNPRLRPGMTGTARVAVGRKAIGWILFHDLWHWWRRWTF